ncbi:DNA methyltransferase [Streptomyces sp. B93]|uniref:DNA methyltransferase n=1 Tax=Streptomyces sp. B93 TaxID=2824875 RepID=UPI001B384D50|nr:DNA methyltransferase [Streptomyces sp. B93]MBQ1091389.1 site-specific DNA-methyltransferase [Streptomyces sp. B93]
MTADHSHSFARPRPLVSVWPTGQVDSRAQLAERCYVPETAHDADRMPPAMAAHAIATYTRRGDTVLDPDCGAGTVLTEALRSGRHAIGLTGQRRWWPVARANVTAAKHDGAALDGMVLDTSPASAVALLAGLAGHIALVLTALRPSTGPASGRAAPEEPAARLRQALTECRPMLRPGGHVIVTVRPHWHRDQLLDLTGRALSAGREAGLVPVERCVALLAALRGDQLIVRASLAQRRGAARLERAIGHPIMLTAHHDVLVFRAPHEETSAAAVRTPQLAEMSRRHAADEQEHDELMREVA